MVVAEAGAAVEAGAVAPMSRAQLLQATCC